MQKGTCKVAYFLPIPGQRLVNRPIGVGHVLAASPQPHRAISGSTRQSSNTPGTPQ